MSKTNQRAWKQITEEEFKRIKQFQDLGIPSNAVSKLLVRGSGTIASVYSSNTLEEHKQRQLDKKHKSLASMAAKDKPVIAREAGQFWTDTPESIVHTQTATEHSMLRIAVALERLADAWENTPKRRLF